VHFSVLQQSAKKAYVSKVFLKGVLQLRVCFLVAAMQSETQQQSESTELSRQ